MALVLALFFSIFVGPVVAFYLYRRFWCFREFRKEGIPGPSPNWLVGNAGELADDSTRHLLLPKWTKKYGKMYGYYEGSQAILVSSDIQFITQVFIKQFPAFHGRKIFPLQTDPDHMSYPVTMFDSRGDRWKRLRTIANPMFSAGKLRSLIPLMEKCQKEFMALVDEKVSKESPELNIFECYKALTLDTIAETAFGVELNSAAIYGKNESNAMLDTCNEMFHSIFDPTYVSMLAFIVPELNKLLHTIEATRGRLFGNGSLMAQTRMIAMMREIIEARRRELKPTSLSNRRADILQMMVDVEESNVVDPALLAGHKGLTVDEITGQAVLFMIAGYETSSNALAFTSYCLVKNRLAQERLLQEIDQHFKDPKKVADYDSVHDLPYMDAVINEALRLYPVAPLVINRLAMEDAEINGIRLAKGVVIQPDVWTLHRDEEQWGPVDVEAFHPERFLDDYPTTSSRSEAAFMPFGFGPRICIGQRFALLEIKMTLVNLLRKYRFEVSQKTPDHLKILAGFTITPKEGVWLKLVPRK